MESIYNMKLHERLNGEKCGLDKWICIIRVPGGWLYQEVDADSNTVSVTFVPFNNEFMTNRK